MTLASFGRTARYHAPGIKHTRLLSVSFDADTIRSDKVRKTVFRFSRCNQTITGSELNVEI
jgi:hypothetical protein